MLLAAVLAMLFTVNLPLSVALVWISNPLTMPPLFYGAYRLGAFILQEKVVEFNFQLSFSWLEQILETIAPALLLGSFILGISSAFIGYFLFRAFWRFTVAKRWGRRGNK
jgi:hypothetical protein